MPKSKRDLGGVASDILLRAADSCRRYQLLPILLTAYVCTMFFFNNDVLPRRTYYYVVLPIAALLTLPFAARALRTSTILWAAGAYLLFLGLASIGQPDLPVGKLVDHVRKSLLVLSFLIILAFLVCNRERFLERFFLAIVLAGAASALVNMFLFYSNPLNSADIAAVRLQAVIGMPGHGVSTSISLTYAVLFVGSAATLLAGRLPGIHRGLLAAAAAVLFVALIATQTRGSLLAVLSGLLVLLLGPTSRRAKLVMLTSFVAAVVVIVVISAFQARMLSLATSDRPELWSRYLAIAAEHPWFGYGMWSDIQITLKSGVAILHPHNLVLSAQIRGGLFAALAMIALLTASLMCAFRVWRQQGLILPLSLTVTIAVAVSFDYEVLTNSTAWPWVTFWLPIATCVAAEMMIQQAYLGREHKPAVKPASAPAATPRAGGELHEGGFVNPFARTVFRDQGPVGPDEERSMVSGLQSVYSGGGFFNPYARSVAPRSTQATAPAAAASPEQAAPSAPKADASAASGGFYNPAARSIETKR